MACSLPGPVEPVCTRSAARRTSRSATAGQAPSKGRPRHRGSRSATRRVGATRAGADDSAGQPRTTTTLSGPRSGSGHSVLDRTSSLTRNVTSPSRCRTVVDVSSTAVSWPRTACPTLRAGPRTGRSGAAVPRRSAPAAVRPAARTAAGAAVTSPRQAPPAPDRPHPPVFLRRPHADHRRAWPRPCRLPAAMPCGKGPFSPQEIADHRVVTTGAFVGTGRTAHGGTFLIQGPGAKAAGARPGDRPGRLAGRNPGIALR